MGIKFEVSFTNLDISGCIHENTMLRNVDCWAAIRRYMPDEYLIGNLMKRVII